MKKKIFLLLLFYSSFAFSQQEASVWYFGRNAGLKFNPDGSVTALTGGQLYTEEGCSSIADSNGNLLFYTDGRTVYDRNHVIMPHGNFVAGTGLFGDPSSTQSAIIVPKPNNLNVYYIFTVDEPHDGNAAVFPNAFLGIYNDDTSTPLDDDGLNNGFNYSVVDLSVIGNNGSIGDVISSNNPLVTYNPAITGEEIKFKCSEKITAVKDFTDNSYWVITQFIDKFYSFKVSATGVSSTPVISTLAPTIVFNGYRRNGQGYMKASPNGEKIAVAHSQNANNQGENDLTTGSVYVYDFDISTGVVSNPIPVINNVKAYGIEFSKDSNVLYASYEVPIYEFQTIKIAQFDLQSIDIANSKIIIHSLDVTFAALQLGINDKIYFCNYSYNYLGVINNPNVLGIGCNYVEQGQFLAPNSFCTFGLPPFITSFFNVSFTAENLCFTDNTLFTLNTTETVTNILWDFGDGFTSNNLSPTHQYAALGNYTVTVTATTGTGTSTKTRQITISQIPYIANTISNQSTCGNASTIYDLSQFTTALIGSQLTSNFGVAYFATLLDATNHNNMLSPSYVLSVGINTIYAKVYSLANVNCNAITNFTVTLFAKPVITTVPEIFTCDDVTNDGIALFDLQSSTLSVLGTQNQNDFNITYHSSQNDADNNTNILPLNYQNISNPQTIFVRIENKLNSLCYITNSFQIGLYKLPIANVLQNMDTCDDVSNDGVESFDLLSQNATVLGTQLTGDFGVSYYLSLIDAVSATNAITSPFVNTVSPQTLYARLENRLSGTCFATLSFELIVYPKPVINMDDSFIICEGIPLTIYAPIGFSGYLWSNATINPSTTITQPGNYNIKVTQDYGNVICDTEKNFVVYNSNIATITHIITNDWTNNENNITINVTGNGDYEYSLDNINFQDSNQFYGLLTGEYNVFVRDKKGCGTAIDEVFLLMYPKFFTPNGDNYNEKWHIEFSSIEPNMKIIIYNRYGKLITEFFGNDLGWDGTLNNQQLPSDDYWFIVTRSNGKDYKGHFTMKR